MKFCITMLCIQRCHAECHVLFIFTLNLVMLSVEVAKLTYVKLTSSQADINNLNYEPNSEH